MSKIVVLGEESFTLGFELVGIEAYSIDRLELILEKNSDVGIAVISQEDYDNLSTKLKTQISRTLKPIVVILSEDDVKGGSLREQVIRALGVDLLK